MTISRRKLWVAPLLLVFGSSRANAKEQEKPMAGAHCGESIIRYGPECKVRVGQECQPRLGNECHPTRLGPACAPRIAPQCLPNVIPDDPLPPQ